MNILLRPTSNMPGWHTPCLFKGEVEGDKLSKVSVSGCHNSTQTLVSIAGSQLPGVIDLSVVDGITNIVKPQLEGEGKDYSAEEDTTDYLIPPEDTFETELKPFSGPLPSSVVLKIDIKYDNGLLQYFGNCHTKTKEWIDSMVELCFDL